MSIVAGVPPRFARPAQVNLLCVSDFTSCHVQALRGHHSPLIPALLKYDVPGGNFGGIIDRAETLAWQKNDAISDSRRHEITKTGDIRTGPKTGV